MAIKGQASAAMFDKLFERFLQDNRWREVWLLTASALDEASVFLTSFRRAVDRFIAGDKKLEEMARRAYDLAQASPLEYEIERVRGSYWRLFFDRSRPLNEVLALPANNIVAHYLSEAHSLACDLANEYAGDLGRARQLVDALLRARFHVRQNVFNVRQDIGPVTGKNGPAYNVARRLKQAMITEDPVELYQGLTLLLPDMYRVLIDSFHQFSTHPDYLLERNYIVAALVIDLAGITEDIQNDSSPELVQVFADYLAALADWSNGSCYPGLDTALAALLVPAADADSTTWEAFLEQIEGLQEYIDQVIKWELSEKQAERIAQYFQAINLFEACLYVSYATNREAIRESLLLPPGMWQPDSDEGSEWGL
jgi:hypothetical protein